MPTTKQSTRKPKRAAPKRAPSGRGRKPKTVSTDLAVAFVLDKSGSMGFGGITSAAIAGFNEYIAELREQEGETIFSLTLFDTDFTQPYIGVSIEDVEPLTGVSYQPNGNTALYDAIGFTAKDLEKRLKAQGREDMKVLVVTLTDGCENSSTDYDAESLADLVRKYEAKGNYTFVYLGLGQTQEYVASLSGIGYMGDNASYPAMTTDSVKGTMNALASATSSHRSSPQMSSQNLMADAGLSINEDEAEKYAGTSIDKPTKGGLLDHLTGGGS